MKKIPLTQGQFAIVDDEDFEELSKHKWFADKWESGFYAGRNITVASYKQKKQKMHRVIMKAKAGEIIDHINHDTLDNRKSNLRVTNKSGNNMNSLPRKCNVTGYKGVYWFKPNKTFVGKIRIKGKLKHLGYHSNPTVLASRYNQEAKEHFGEFALLNKI